MDDLTAYNLIKDARAAAVAGDREEATRLCRQAVDIQPNDKDAWLLLASLVDDPAEKRQIVERVLTMDPFNQEAKAALARLDGGSQAQIAPETLHCANHPDRETMLRCNRCNKPICTECAVQTPVGYRCRECVRGQQDKFYTAKTSNQLLAYVAAAAGGLILGVLGGLLGIFLPGFIGWIVAVFAGPAVGGALAEVIWQAAGRKRSRNLDTIVTVIVLGAAALVGLPIALSRGIYGLITVGVFVALAVSTLYARTRFRS